MILKQHNKYDIKGGFTMDVITKKKIGQAINTLLAEQNKRQKDLAKELGVTDNTISYFVSGSRTPNLEQITTIADFFNVSTDFLLGRTKAHTQNTEIRAICDYTGLSEKAVLNLHLNKTRMDNTLRNNPLDLETQETEFIRFFNRHIGLPKCTLDFINLLIESHDHSMGMHLYNYKTELNEAIERHCLYIDDRETTDKPDELKTEYSGKAFNTTVLELESEKGREKEQFAKYAVYEAADEIKKIFKKLASAEEDKLKEIKNKYKELNGEFPQEVVDLINEERFLLKDFDYFENVDSKDSENNGNDN